MSNRNPKSQINEKKSVKKKKEIKSPSKSTDLPKTTQRSKITMNWNQFLLRQNTDLTKVHKKDKKPLGNKLNEKPSKLQPVESAMPGYPPMMQQQMSQTPGYPPFPNYHNQAIAIDCEMVGVGDGRENMLARVSLVDDNGICVYDTFVKATEPVVDYRTYVSGVRPADMENGREFSLVQKEVHNIIHGKILVGHGLSNDLKVLRLSHPKKYIRDTSKYRHFREMNHGATPSLKNLARHILEYTIQEGEHSSVEDARATMNIYLRYRHQWETDIRNRNY